MINFIFFLFYFNDDIIQKRKKKDPLCVKFKNYNVSIYIKNGDFYCTTGDVKCKFFLMIIIYK